MARESVQKLLRENQELRLRLEEAEETLRAIRSGEVDALVVESTDGPRIYALDSVNQSYRTLVEAMSEGAACISNEGAILYCNSRFASMLGLPLQEVMGKSVETWVPSAEQTTFQNLLRQVRQGQGHGRAEISLKTRAGRGLPAALSISAIEEAGRQVLCMVATDVRQSEERFRLLADGMQDYAIFMLGPDGLVSDWNVGAQRLKGYRADEIIGRHFSCFYTDEDVRAAKPQHELDGAAEQGRIEEEGWRVRKDGTRFWADAIITALRDDAGNLRAFAYLIRDFTERTQAQEVLRQSDERYRLVLQATNDALWDINLDTSTVFWNEAYATIFDRPPSTQHSWDWWREHIHPDDRDRAMEGLRSAIEGDASTWSCEYRFQRKDGSWVDVLDRAVIARDPSGQARRIVGAMQDQTDRKCTEAALRAANLQLAEADRRKNAFLAMLSHELRNPLAPIRNSAYILEYAAPGSEKARRALAVIDRQAAQLARLVDDLLDVTRISRNKIQLQRRRLELNELVGRTVEDYRSLFDAADIRLEFLASPAPVFVDADCNRLAQVLGNLLQNAAKFMGRGGATSVSVATDPAEHRAILRVADTGVGMTPEMLSHLFQPFSQADATLDRSKGGLGLGLALVKGLVELHGGEVSAFSAGIGKGSEFIIRLPLDLGTFAPPPPARQDPAKGHHRILLIEDNIDSAESLREVLELGDHEVAVAYNGPEGIAKAREFCPDVALCDIGLPGMDGYAVARAFRADTMLNRTFLVALSGYALPEDLLRAQEAGFERHLAKPLSLDKLERILGSLPMGRPVGVG